MDQKTRLHYYATFAEEYLQAVRAYTESRPNQRSKAPWQALVDTGLEKLQDIPANEFAPKAYWLLKAYPDLEKRLITITDFLPEDAGLVERQYCVYHNLTARPSCGHCGKELVPKRDKFRFVEAKGGKVKSGYGDYCNIKCASAAEETVSKRKATNLERRGVEVPAQAAEVRDKMKATMRERHGEESFARTDAFREGARERNREQFGVDAVPPFAAKEVREKTKATFNERYGTDNAMGVKEFADKAGDGKRRHAYQQLLTEERVGQVEPMFAEDEYMGVMADRDGGLPHRYPWRCKVCDTEFMDSLETDSSSGHNQPRCPKCFPKYVSIGEAALRSIVNEALPGVEVIHGDREVLDGTEVDILVPSLKLAIEYNGLYWHSEFGGQRGPEYHQQKLEQLASKGYRLLYVWEDEWFQQTDAVRHMLTEACGSGIHINAGDCQIVTGKQYQSVAGSYNREGSLGGVVTTYALLTEAGGVAATLQVAQRPSKKKGVPGKAALRYTVANGYQVPNGFGALLDKVVAGSRGDKVFYTEIDPSFDNVALYKEQGFSLGDEKGCQQWYLARPYQFRSRLDKSELIERVSEKDPTMNTKTTMTGSRLQAVGADRIWGVKRQVWELHHTTEK